MMSLPNEKKWQLYCSQRLQGSTNNTSHNDRNDPKNNDGTVQSVWTTGGLSNDPQAYVDKVRLSVRMVSEWCFEAIYLQFININKDDLIKRTKKVFFEY